MNIKPVIPSDTYQVAASTETREETREHRPSLPFGGRKRKQLPKDVPVIEETKDPQTGDERLRESQTIDSETVVALLSRKDTVNLHAAKAFKCKKEISNPPSISDEKKLDKSL